MFSIPLRMMMTTVTTTLMNSKKHESSTDSIAEREKRWAEVRKMNDDIFQKQLERYSKDPDGYSKMKGWED